MTIAISLKVNDGVVLAADSASTLVSPRGVHNVYNHANKIFNLLKGKPVGATTWGAGSIGQSSISTLMKDFRKRLKKGVDSFNPDEFNIEDVARRLRRFMFEEKYQEAFKDIEDEKKPEVGFVVAGFSAEEGLAEEYLVSMGKGSCEEPTPIRRTTEIGIQWNGEGEAISRLLLCMSNMTHGVLTQKLGISEAQVEKVMDIFRQNFNAPVIHPAMPIQDAIDLARFLVDLTINFSRFMPGPPTVGGAIEIAAITKHEGFKWVRRKHYFDASLNPPEA